MKIVVINGTPIKGVTYFMKEEYLSHFRGKSEITQFYPKDFPPFCTGCKNCFVYGEEKCPHSEKTSVIWNAIMSADIIVFAYPVYALRAPASIKSLLDHLCPHWLVHRPEPEFFKKAAVIITNSVGAPNGSAQNDVKTSLNWMGLSRVYTCGAGMMGDIFIDKITAEHKKMLTDKMRRLADKTSSVKPCLRMNLKVAALFKMAKMQHAMILKSEAEPGLDSAHYIKHGWIKRK